MTSTMFRARTAGLVRRVVKNVRWLPGIRRLAPIWERFRAPYERFLNRSGSMRVRLGGVVDVTLPTSLARYPWENYEGEALQAYTEWIRSNPTGIILDVGAEVGAYTATALQLTPTTEVVAFDSDIAALAIVRDCAELSAAPQRLSLVFGFVSNEHKSNERFDAVRETTFKLVEPLRHLQHDQARFRLLTESETERSDIPIRSLDGLLAGVYPASRPMLIKCDIEGAEWLAFHGARRLLEENRPTLLVSIHPKHLVESYDTTRERMVAYLEGFRYKMTLLAQVHEEHWLGTPR